MSLGEDGGRSTHPSYLRATSHTRGASRNSKLATAWPLKRPPCGTRRWPCVSHFMGGGDVAESGADRDRTGDPLLAKQVLSQLSYRPEDADIPQLNCDLPCAETDVCN